MKNTDIRQKDPPEAKRITTCLDHQNQLPARGWASSSERGWAVAHGRTSTQGASHGSTHWADTQGAAHARHGWATHAALACSRRRTHPNGLLWVLMEHLQSHFGLDDPHDNLALQEGVSQLWVLQEHVPGLLGVVLNAHLHLFHQLKHLFWGQ